MEDQHVFIVSDLHLADSLGNGLFDDSESLVRFLGWVERQAPCHLVVAGDCFEFLSSGGEATPPLAFDAAGATNRLRTILDCHRAIFDGLRRLAADERISISILGGNHDVEIGLPAPLAFLRRELGPRINWLVHGEALHIQAGSLRMLVEHGDLYDDWNRVSHGPLTVAGRLVSRGMTASGFHPPPGSSIVIDVVEPIRRERWPWVVWLKPERDALLPILHFLMEPREQLRLLSAASRPLISGWLPEVPVPWKAKAGSSVRGSSSNSNSYSFQRWLDETRRDATRSRGTKAKLRLIERLRKVAAVDGFFDHSAPDSTFRDIASQHISSNLDLIVYGHTHSAKVICQDERRLYVNTGTWCPLLRLPEQEQSNDDWEAFVESLRANEQEPIRRPTFVEVRIQGYRTSVQLGAFGKLGTGTLSYWVKEEAGLWHQEDQAND